MQFNDISGCFWQTGLLFHISFNTSLLSVMIHLLNGGADEFQVKHFSNGMKQTVNVYDRTVIVAWTFTYIADSLVESCDALSDVLLMTVGLAGCVYLRCGLCPVALKRTVTAYARPSL